MDADDNMVNLSLQLSKIEMATRNYGKDSKPHLATHNRETPGDFITSGINTPLDSEAMCSRNHAEI